MKNKPKNELMFYDREYFESRLPIGRLTGILLWREHVQLNGELTYLINFGGYKSYILIRSNINPVTDHSHTHQGALIRLTLMNNITGDYLLDGVPSYVIPGPGWEEKLFKQLTRLKELSETAGICKACNEPKKIYHTKGDKLYAKCRAGHGARKWLQMN